MQFLGIESTAHTFGIGIATDAYGKKHRILANVKDTYIPPLGWGIKPIEAAEHHRKVCNDVLQKALQEAKISLNDIDVFAFSQGPGLPPCLKVGLDFASKIARKKPLIGVNHCIAHIEIGRMASKCRDPVTLYVSGANTQVISFVSGRYRVFGETQDIGIGNALDKFGREVGMGFPAGPGIEQEAKGGRYQELPYSVKGMDLSFSGLVTEAVRRVKAGSLLNDVCRSLQETAFAMLTEVTERAMAHTDKTEALLTGGVAANRRLQEMLNVMCKERGARFCSCPIPLSGDNGAMIAWTGILMHKSGVGGRRVILPAQRTDDVEVSWLDYEYK
jgi:N6-L-threonylcarbamoyladenine synthase